MWSLHKNIQSLLKFLNGSIFGPILILLYINDLPDGFICNIAIYADDTLECDQASDLWQQLELAPNTGAGHEVACWLQYWKNSTGFIWLA